MCGRFTAGVAGLARRQRRAAGGVRARAGQRAARRRIGLDPSGRGQPRHRHHAGAREVGDMIDALERLPWLLGRRDRHHRHQQRLSRQARPAKAGGRRETDRRARSATTPGPQATAATINCVRNRGNTESRNEKVSRSMIRKSRKVSDSCRMSNLKRDSAISSTTRASDSAAADARSRQHQQEQAIDEDPRQHRQRDRERSVFRATAGQPAPQDEAARPGQRRA